MGTAAPHRLGDFEIGREIGRGGMGVVYEARQVSLNRQVALKVLSGGLGLTPKAVQRFRREAEAAAKLHHTNIVPVYATGEENGTHFYAMELIDGPSLDRVIRQLRQAPSRTPEAGPDSAEGLAATGPYVETFSLSSEEAAALSSSGLSSDSSYFDTVARMVAEVADGLDYAHRQGVIHRDIKPSNLLLAPSGRLSINDFGLARILEQPGMTLTGEFVGTPRYMSPEQITAGRAPLDHRTDIYSLGATLYELLTWQPPFAGEQREQLLGQILHKEPSPPRRVNKRVPVDLETICLKCLEKDPDRRYQTAANLADDLRRHVNRFAIAARRVGLVGRLIKWVRRRPAIATSLACVALALGVATFFAIQAYRAEQQRRVEQARAQEDLQSVHLENAVAAAMGGDLDKAEKAIREAEAYGASTGQVLMLRGQVAFGRGDWERALADMQEAVKLDPDSAAARGMLAMAYLGFGDFHRYAQTATELQALTPRTTEDYLFRGYAQQWLGVGLGLEDLDVAVKRSHSPLARAMRADSRKLLAEDRADPEEAEQVLADVQAAKESLEDNPYVISVSLWTHVMAANLYLADKKPERRQAALEVAKHDAEVLRRWDTLTFPFYSLWVYFEQTGQEPALFDLARRAAENSDAPVFADQYAQALYRRGHSREALEVLDRRKSKTFVGDYFRACILAELHPQDLSRARAACEDMAKRYHTSLHYYVQEILCLLGDKDLPEHFSENKNLWYLKSGNRSKWGLLAAHYRIALMRLAKGDRAGARERLRQAVQTRVILNYDSDFSRSFLARMEKDPTWPPWIPVRK
jgi:tetratricopeptide (TPR) repeat protein